MERKILRIKMANQMVSNGATSGLTRERSFIRTPHQNKRRSLAFNQQSSNSIQHDVQQQQQQQQMRSKPAIEIYRPPSKLNRKAISCFELLVLIRCFIIFIDIRSDGNSAQNKLNVNAPEFTVNREVQNTQPVGYFSSPNAQYLQHSKSSGNIQHQIQLAVARHHAEQMANINPPPPILVSHPIHLQQLGLGMAQSQPTNAAPLNVSGHFACFVQRAIDLISNHLLIFLLFEDCSCTKSEVCIRSAPAKSGEFKYEFSTAIKILVIC